MSGLLDIFSLPPGEAAQAAETLLRQRAAVAAAAPVALAEPSRPEPTFQGWAIPIHRVRCGGCAAQWTYPGPALSHWSSPAAHGYRAMDQWSAAPETFPRDYRATHPVPEQKLMAVRTLGVCHLCPEKEKAHG